jgi:SAM-dependent methyltransferase
MEPSYTLDNAWIRARERLALLESVLDPGSVRHLEALGVGEGWHCLEVGGGEGSLAEWLCRRVGHTGQVLATDIDTRFLDVLTLPNLEVRRHDITTDALPEGACDLVHTRTVLSHLAKRDVALQRMVSALKPGGWLLVEEMDFVSWVADPRARAANVYAKGWAAAHDIFRAGGADFHYGRRLYRDVCSAGLGEVDAEGRVPVMYAGTPAARFWRLTFEQLHERIVGSGLLTNEEMDEFLAAHDDEDFVWMGNIIMAVWGRKIPGPTM